jgi:hypothetical protein
MKNNLRSLAFMAITGTLLAAGLSSCKKEDALQDGDVKAAAIVTVGTCNSDLLITASTTWSSANTYVLRGKVRVLPPATLTIQAGTTIQGECDGTLIIERGGKISAIGTAASPIVFTSNKPVGSRVPGDWGGVIILGRAQNNQGQNVPIEGVPVGGPGNSALGYHGPGGALNNADNSGSFRFVRIEYAGQNLPTQTNPTNEVNGLTLGSVGSGTVIDHVQVIHGNDDAFEWFGGTVNAKYLYSYNTRDDDFDTDFGFTGKIQFAAGVRGSLVDVSANSSNGFESDNDATGSTLTPLTNPAFVNVTLVGPCGADGANFGSGVLARRNSALDLYNANIYGWGKAGTAAINYTGASAPCAGFNVQNVTLQNYTPGATALPSVATCFALTLAANNAACPATPTTPVGDISGAVTPTSGLPAVTVPFTWTAANFRGAFNPAGDSNWTGAWLSFKALGQ